MKQQLASLIPFLLLLPTLSFAAAAGTLMDSAPQQKQGSAKPTPKQASKPAEVSLAGCVDQAQDGSYILIHDQTRDRIATLVAEGFPVEGFAKYLGQKVTVRGTSGPDESSSSFRVRSVEVVSDRCGQ